MTTQEFIKDLANYKMEKEIEECEGDTEICPDCGKVECMCYEDYQESREI